MNNTKHPEVHVNEEPRNDLIDVGTGFVVAAVSFLVVATIVTVMTIFIN